MGGFFYNSEDELSQPNNTNDEGIRLVLANES